jgi:hypothetical protein
MEWLVIMDLKDKEDRLYYILSRIKYLDGQKQLILDGEESNLTLEDIEARKQALTNLIEML